MANITNRTFDNSTLNVTLVFESVIPPIIQFCFGVLGNVIAFCVLKVSSKRHHWRPFYRLVLGMVVTDLIGIMFIFPAVLLRYDSNFTFVFPEPLCTAISFVLSFTLLSASCIICAMSADRCLAAVYPYSYDQNKNFRTGVILVTIWLLSAFISALNSIILADATIFYPGSWCFFNFLGTDTIDKVNTYLYACIGLLILLFTMVLNAIVIYFVCRKAFDPKTRNQKRKRTDIYAIVFLLAMMIVFGICWTPLMIRLILNASGAYPIDEEADLFALRMTVTSSITDPWIYILLRRENIQAVLRCLPGQRARLNLNDLVSHISWHITKGKSDRPDPTSKTDDAILESSPDVHGASISVMSEL